MLTTLTVMNIKQAVCVVNIILVVKALCATYWLASVCSEDIGNDYSFGGSISIIF
jgi:hypothetical protein